MATSMDYQRWLKDLDKYLRAHRPDIQVKDINPNSTYQAFVSGESPFSFGRRPTLNLLSNTVIQPTPNYQAPSQTSFGPPPPRRRKLAIISSTIGIAIVLGLVFLVLRSEKGLEVDRGLVGEWTSTDESIVGYERFPSEILEKLFVRFGSDGEGTIVYRAPGRAMYGGGSNQRSIGAEFSRHFTWKMSAPGQFKMNIQPGWENELNRDPFSEMTDSIVDYSLQGATELNLHFDSGRNWIFVKSG